MSTRILFPGFREELEFTRYPFADSALLTSAESGQQIEVDTFLDASLYPIGAAARLYISSITITVREITLTIGDEENAELATAIFDPLVAPDVLVFTDSFDRPAGVIISESLKLSRFSAWPVGVHTFELGETEFAASVVIPTPAPGVRGILTEAGDLFTGDIWIVGDDGVVVREIDGNIRIDIVGDPLFARRLCSQLDLFTPPNFLKTINGCAPDANGNFNLTVGENLSTEPILRIYPTDTGLKIEAVGNLIQRVN